MLVRPMTEADAPAVARIHRQTWRQAYRGIVSDAYLDGDQPGHDAAAWRQRSARPSHGTYHRVYEARLGGIRGIASAGPDRADNQAYDIELYCLYVCPGAQGCGIGRQLVTELARVLVSAGNRSLRAWVLSDNASARGFYQRLGAQQTHSRCIDLAGQRLRETAYVWSDMARLVSA